MRKAKIEINENIYCGYLTIGKLMDVKENYPYSYSDFANKAIDGDTQILKSGTTIDKNHGAWQLVTMTEAQAAEYSVRVPDQLIRRGEWYWSPDEPTASDPKKYVYVVADQFGKPYIRPRYYVTEIVDPDLYWSAWMVSAYLCNKEGEIIGNWF